METIKNYIKNIFSTLPKNQKTLDLKNELLNNMLDRYDELKANGKNENEAIGIVISEFDNIDELLNKINISIPENNISSKILTLEDSHEFINLKAKTSKLTALGVGLILWVLSIVIVLKILTENNIIFKDIDNEFTKNSSAIISLLFIASAVCIFITAESKLKLYKYIEEGQFELDSCANTTLNNEFIDFKSKKSKYTIAGVALCILSPIPGIIGNTLNDMYSALGISLLFIIISIAVSLFIYSSTIDDSYKRLLKEGNFNPAKREENKLIDAISHTIWSFAISIFLFLGFTFNMWKTCWLIFPITGITFSAFKTFYKIWKNQNRDVS